MLRQFTPVALSTAILVSCVLAPKCLAQSADQESSKLHLSPGIEASIPAPYKKPEPEASGTAAADTETYSNSLFADEQQQTLKGTVEQSEVTPPGVTSPGVTSLPVSPDRGQGHPKWRAFGRGLGVALSVTLKEAAVVAGAAAAAYASSAVYSSASVVGSGTAPYYHRDTCACPLYTPAALPRYAVPHYAVYSYHHHR